MMEKMDRKVEPNATTIRENIWRQICKRIEWTNEQKTEMIEMKNMNWKFWSGREKSNNVHSTLYMCASLAGNYFQNTMTNKKRAHNENGNACNTRSL